MNPTLELRPARAEDLPAVADLWQALCAQHAAYDPSWEIAPTGRAAYLAGLEAALASPLVVLRVAADAEGDVAGYCHGVVRMQPGFWRETRIGTIVSICSDPGARGGGIGAALVESVVAAFRELGIERVETLVSAANDGALRFWDRAGFASHARVLSRRIG